MIAVPQGEIQTLDENSGETLRTSVAVSGSVKGFGGTSWGQDTELGEGDSVEGVDHGARPENEGLLDLSKADCGASQM